MQCLAGLKFLNILAFSSIILVSATYLAAEDVQLYEVNFKVEQLRDVDGSSVMVQVFDDQALVAKDQVAHFVANKYLVGQNISKLERADVLRFANNAAKSGSAEFSAKAWTALLESSDKLIEEDYVALKNLEQYKVFPDIVKQIITSTNRLNKHTDLIGWLLCAATETDFEWVRGRIVSFVYISEKSYKTACKDKYLNYWKSSELRKSDELLKSFQELFGEGDPWFLELRKQHETLHAIFKAIQENDAKQLSNIQEFLSSNAEQKQLLVELIVKKIHAKAELSIKENKPDLALALLAWLSQSWRTPTTHDLVLKALRMLPSSAVNDLLADRRSDFLYFVAEKDYTVKAVYLAYLQLALLKQIDQKDSKHFDRIFLNILKLRPDPDFSNDNLRINLAVSLSTLGNRDSAHQYLATINRPLNWIEWVRLLFAGAFVNVKLLWLLIVTFLVFLIIFIYKLPTRISPVTNTKIEKDRVEHPTRPVFTFNQMRANVDPRWQEYEKLLKGFGLSSNASLTDIKSAYRKAVKMLHPDANPNLSEAEQEKFRRITEHNARIIELRVQLGLN